MKFQKAVIFLTLAVSFQVAAPGLLLAQQPEIPEAAAAFESSMNLRNEGRLSEAEQAMRQALALAPDNAGYQFEMANLHAMFHDHWRTFGDLQKARDALWSVSQDLEHVLTLAPDYLPARFNLGVTLKRLEEYERAREVLRQVIREAEARGEPKIAVQAYAQIAATYEEQGFFDEARDAYQAARELDFYSPEIRTALEDLELREKEYNAKRQRRDAMNSMDTMSRAWREARVGTGYREGESSSANLQQVIPYLGMMLAQQFLGRNGNSDMQES